jgi:hypothetical protein
LSDLFLSTVGIRVPYRVVSLMSVATELPIWQTSDCDRTANMADIQCDRVDTRPADEHIVFVNFTCGFVWVCNFVSDVKRGTETVGVCDHVPVDTGQRTNELTTWEEAAQREAS